jgi:hypothetical protein
LVQGTQFFYVYFYYIFIIYLLLFFGNVVTGNEKEELGFTGDRIVAAGAVKKNAYIVTEKLGCLKLNTSEEEYVILMIYLLNIIKIDIL